MSDKIESTPTAFDMKCLPKKLNLKYISFFDGSFSFNTVPSEF